MQDDPSIYYDECCLIVTLRHTRALLTANALLTSSAANQMSRKTTSRNVNNAIYGQPRGSIGARACRPLQLCLPLPLSVRPFLSLSLCLPLPESSFVRVFLLPLTFYKLFVLFRVAALSYYVRRAQYLLLPQVKFTCKGKKKTTP